MGVARYGGISLLDDKAKDCGYCSLPDYWEEQVAYLASKVSAKASTVCPTFPRIWCGAHRKGPMSS